MPRSRLWPDPRVKPPFGAAEIDWAHPLARGLDLYWLLWEGGGPPAPLYARIPLPLGTSLGGARWHAGPRGLSITTPDAGAIQEEYRFTAPTYALPQVTGTAVIAASMLFSPTDGIAHGPCMFCRNQADFTAGYFNATKYLDNNLYFGWHDGTTDHRIVVAASSVFANGDDVQLALAYDTGGTPKETLYANGISKGTSSTLATVATSGATARIRLLNAQLEDEVPSSGNAFGAPINQVIVWGRTLPASDLIWLAAEPYAMLTPVVRRRYFVPEPDAATLMGAMSL